MVAESLTSQLPMLLLLSGAALIGAEAFAPGANFFVLGIGLFTAGLVGVVLPAGLGSIALVIMAIAVLVATGITLYISREFDLYTNTGEGKTTDSSSLRGETGRVTERVTTTDGKVKLDNGGFNPLYEARSVDGEIAEGETIMVVDPGGGNVLTVESFSDATDDIDRELAREREASEREAESES
jgi:membrane protein implicated in regulation of membrane protease activity